MPLVNTDNDDDDTYSLSSITNSDEDFEEAHSYDHRLCSRYASCNKKKHEHSSDDSTKLTKHSKNSKFVIGSIRPIANQPGRRQKYDGCKWRRICDNSNCSVYLSGVRYIEKGLCRKHCLLSTENNVSDEPDNSIIEDTTRTILDKRYTKKTPARHKTKRNKSPKRGDLMIDTDGKGLKYDGHSWRYTCTNNNCKSYLVRNGFCQRHYLEMKKKQSENSSTSNNNQQEISSISNNNRQEISSTSNNNQQENSTTKLRSIRTKPSVVLKPKKGDIQLIRQLWNGTKWYSLCHHPTQNCTKRSTGKHHRYLCEQHYKESLEKQKNPNLIDDNDIIIESTAKRKKLIHEESFRSDNSIDESNSIILQRSKSSIDQVKHTEQCIQTEVTYPLDSTDLRQGCFLIDDDDDNDDRNQSESSPAVVCIKKEDDIRTNKRNVSINVNPISIDCKLEIPKLEI
ncbi:unnamed protein product [Adineta steineri]|uniref:Uncharacterized protein n=1 Tax=Adineta steineri TaxID=433720 RepID=A0A813YQL6_9BILA|nr:unnamed protein product [Adineta steineri]CAF3717105.1 unnamed protein product [Adineta steineri]